MHAYIITYILPNGKSQQEPNRHKMNPTPTYTTNKCIHTHTHMNTFISKPNRSTAEIEKEIQQKTALVKQKQKECGKDADQVGASMYVNIYVHTHAYTDVHTCLDHT
jgi:hypothetical protein